MNKIALITGPTSGIGYATSLELASKGFDLILVARNIDKCSVLQTEIGDQVKTDCIQCDLSDIQSVLRAVETIRKRYTKIDVLINNAGIIVDKKQFSVDGIELTFATNHIGPFVLTTGLISLLKASGNARIVNVSSAAHYFAFFGIEKLVNPKVYHDLVVYGRSKLANILFSNELSDRLSLFGVTSNAVHPGTVASNFAGRGGGVTAQFMKLFRKFFKTNSQGAATSVYVATAPQLEGVSGRYYVNCKPVRTSRAARNRELGKALWKLSEDLTKRG
jgi:NAD(P)-dependent dehydrogenase (short-subunit alcohol dehydrogenase family)